MMSGQKVGVLSLEEAPKRTLLGLVGIHLNKNLLVDRGQATDQEVLDGFDDLFNGRTCVLYDSFGTNAVDLICQRIQYMAKALDVDWVILDHVSILVSGMEGDERRELDKAATAFRTLVQELDIGMIMVSHLTRPGGRGHEDGAAVSLSQLRGSHALAQLADSAIGLQKDPDDPDSNVRQVRVLKNRFSGQIGDAGTLVYSPDTGRLMEEELTHLMGDETDPEELGSLMHTSTQGENSDVE
jgi:twinkle protein